MNERQCIQAHFIVYIVGTSNSSDGDAVAIFYIVWRVFVTLFYPRPILY